MEIFRPEFPGPLLIIDGFLPDADAAACLEECIELKRVYMPGGVGNGSENRIDPRVRRNDVVMLDTIFGPAPERSTILTTVNRQLNTAECNKLWHEGYTLFDTINYRTWNESVLSRYGNCNFYGRHRDTMKNPERSGDITRRLVTLVLYFNTEPEVFTGGEISFYEGEKSMTVKPKHNRAVVFPSYMFHEVAKVSLPDDAPFSAGRFSLNRWMGFR